MTSISDATYIGRSRLVGAPEQSNPVLDAVWDPAYLDTRPVPITRVVHYEATRQVLYFPSRRDARSLASEVAGASWASDLGLSALGGVTRLRWRVGRFEGAPEVAERSPQQRDSRDERVFCDATPGRAASTAPESGRACFVDFDGGHLPRANEVIFDCRRYRSSVLVGREVTSERLVVARRDDLVTKFQSNVDPRPWECFDHGLSADTVHLNHRGVEGTRNDLRTCARCCLHVLTGYLRNSYM